MPTLILRYSIQRLVGDLLRNNTRRASQSKVHVGQLSVSTCLFFYFICTFIIICFFFSNFFFFCLLFPFHFNQRNVTTQQRTVTVVIQHNQSVSLLLSRQSKRPKYKAKRSRLRLDPLSPTLNTAVSYASLKG